jgi:Tol biopolymer transport system component
LFTSNRNGNKDLFVVDVECASLPGGCGSNLVQLTNDPHDEISGAWSPDGSRIAFSACHDVGNYEIFVINADGTGEIQLTDNEREDQFPTWSPDGTRLAFTSDRTDDWEIWVMDAECASPPEGCGSNLVQLTDSPGYDLYPVWQP